MIPRLVKKLGLKQTHNPEVFAYQLEQYLQRRILIDAYAAMN